MGLFLLKRFATLIATLAGASLVVFAVLEVLPGNAAQILMGPDASPDAVAALSSRLGLDQPAWQRYGHWISGLLQGDMGLSYAYSTPVSELVLERLALTVPLAIMAMLLTTAIALAVVQAAILARITRSAVLEVLREDFVRTARAKGLSQRAALWGHVLRNALIPVITVMGMQFAELLAGTIVVESVFYLPGLGRLIFQSIANRDLIVVRNCVMLLAAMVVLVNFVVDLLYAVIDPRIQAHDI